jgi:hypothetical protein
MKERTWSLIVLQACSKETPKVSNSLLSNVKFVPATLKVPVRLTPANRLSKNLRDPAAERTWLVVAVAVAAAVVVSAGCPPS